MGLKYNYRCALTINDVQISDTSFVSYTVEKDLRNAMIPKRLLYLKLTTEEINEISDDISDELDIFMTIHRVHVNEMIDDENPPLGEMIYEIECKGMMDKLISAISDIDMTLVEDDVERLMSVETRRIFIYSENENYFNNMIYNTVVDTWSVDLLIADAFDKMTNKDALLFMEKPKNQIRYKDTLIVKPTGFIQLIKDLDKRFNIYNTDADIFIERDTCYILSNDSDISYDMDSENIIRIKVLESSNLFANIAQEDDDSADVIYIEVGHIESLLSLDKFKVNPAYEKDGEILQGKSPFDNMVIHTDYNVYSQKKNNLLQRNLFIKIPKFVTINTLIELEIRGKVYLCRIRYMRTVVTEEMAISELILTHAIES